MPTKIAVMTDVHANLPALQAALSTIEQEGYDLLVHTGDAIAIGPYPAETLDVLLSTPLSEAFQTRNIPEREFICQSFLGGRQAR
jgi:hypothetical protein